MQRLEKELVFAHCPLRPPPRGASGPSHTRPSGALTVAPEARERRHRKTIFKKLPNDFRVFRAEEDSCSFRSQSGERQADSPPRRGVPQSHPKDAVDDVFGHHFSQGNSEHSFHIYPDAYGCGAYPWDHTFLENTRATDTFDSGSESDSVQRTVRKCGLNSDLERLITFAEKFDVVFQLIGESALPERGTKATSAVSLDILRLKFLESEPKDQDFCTLIHKMLAVDSSKYQMVKVGSYDRLGLEVRVNSRAAQTLSRNGRPVSFRKYFKHRLSETVWEFHAQFLDRTHRSQHDTAGLGWHPDFSLDDFYKHLNYEPAETPEYRRALELIRSRQEALSQSGEIAKEKSAQLRQKIYRSLQSNEKSLTSSSGRDKDAVAVNQQLVPEIALKLKLLFRLKKVSNMFLSNILRHFQDKAVCSLFVDETEVWDVMRHIAERAPQWLSFASNQGGTIVKLNQKMDMESVLTQLKTPTS